MFKGKDNNDGFTLVELAITLIVMGMLIALGLGMTGPLTTFIKVRETKELQDAALQSVISWAAARNSIPGSAVFPTVAKSPKDAWGRDFVYKYYSSISTSTPTKDTICGLRSTSLTLRTTDPEATMPNLAFAIFSRTDNPTFRSTLNGVALSASGTASGIITATAPNGDLVRWVTLDELRSKIGCQGAPLKIVNNELPYANYSANYSATIVADGGSGSGSYQWRIKRGSSPSPVNATFFNSSANTIRPLPFQNSSTTNWSASGTSMFFDGNPQLPGSYLFSVFVRDNLGNNSSKSFVLTVNPRSN